MKTSNTELRDKLDVIFQNVEDTGYEKETDLPLYLEWLEALLAQSQTNLLDRVEKALPKKKYFEPMGGPVSHAQSEAFNQALTEVRNSLNQIRKELGNG